MKIIFVCTGNTCRSPMAEGIVKALAPDIEVESRGIFITPGMNTNKFTQQILNEKLAVVLDHPAREISDQDCLNADLVLTMTQSQADFIRNLGECTQVYTLTDFAEEEGDVPDPFGSPLSVYERTYESLIRLINKTLKKIREDEWPSS
ncbi:MAG: low molecular weight protein arginine phosphatase [Clostridiaceae bacterium]